jgi:hypothetical protein
MVIDFIPRLVLKSPFSGFGKRLGISSHRFSESNSVSVAHPKLEGNRSKHIHISGGYDIYFSEVWARAPPRPKDRGLRAATKMKNI